jgi:transposase
MSDLTLPTPDETWSESAKRAHETFVNIITEQSQQLAKQGQQLTELTQQLEQLKRHIKLTSETSSKPPSSDRGKRLPKKPKSSRSKGAQKGHIGKTRARVEPDKIIECAEIAEACDCGGSWRQSEQFSSFQVTELPPIKPYVTEYRERAVSCSCCGKERYITARLPLGESRFGPRVHAMVLELSLGSRLSMRQIKAHLKQAFNLQISLGAISDILKRCAKRTSSAFQKLKRWYQADPEVKHIDETSWYIAGLRGQLIGSLNDQVVLFQASMKRRVPDIMRLIGEDQTRLIICDRALVYCGWIYRQLCWAHVLRDFKYLMLYPEHEAQAQKLVKEAQELFKRFKAHRNAELSTEEYLAQAELIRCRVYQLLTELSEREVDQKFDGMVRNLLKHEAQLWTFLKYPTISIHNNSQESALRPLVIKRLISFGNNTYAGAQRLTQLMSVIETLKRQGRDVFDELTRTFQGEPLNLLPAPKA